MYDYAELRPTVFTEEGVERLTQIRRNIARAIEAAGAVRQIEATKGVYGDDWSVMACVDYMVEKGEIREIPQEGAAGQHRVFVKGRS